MPKEGKSEPVTDEWKRKTLRLMKEYGISRAELSRRLDVTRGAITQLFSTSKTSTLVGPVNKLLASQEVLRVHAKELLVAIDELTVADRKVVDAFLEVILAKSPSEEASHEARTAELRNRILRQVSEMFPRMTVAGRAYLQERLFGEADAARKDLDEATAAIFQAQRALQNAHERAMRSRALVERFNVIVSMFTELFANADPFDGDSSLRIVRDGSTVRFERRDAK